MIPATIVFIASCNKYTLDMANRWMGGARCDKKGNVEMPAIIDASGISGKRIFLGVAGFGLSVLDPFIKLTTLTKPIPNKEPTKGMLMIGPLTRKMA